MLTQILFYCFAGLAILGALMTVTRRNPMASALWLVGTFFALAAIYTLLGAFFIGVIQILVYAGAIMVLFLFVIMLLNLGNQFEADLRGTLWKVLAAGSGLVLIALLARMVEGPELSAEMFSGNASVADQVAQYGAVGAIGVPMFLDYAVALQITGLLLLVAIVGAVMLAKRNA